MAVGQRVRLILVGGFHYSGKVINETETHLKIIDKFDCEVLILKSQIQVCEEVFER
jgi:hypothetical protein